jgi:drug/metabolite transporter (DMT)-like permease
MALCSALVPLPTLVQPVTTVDAQSIYSLALYGYLFVAIVLQATAVMLFCASWKYNTVGTSAVLVYFAIPIGYFFDWLFIGREISSLEILGALIIFVTNIAIVCLRLLKKIN